MARPVRSDPAGMALGHHGPLAMRDVMPQAGRTAAGLTAVTVTATKNEKGSNPT